MCPQLEEPSTTHSVIYIDYTPNELLGIEDQLDQYQVETTLLNMGYPDTAPRWIGLAANDNNSESVSFIGLFPVESEETFVKILSLLVPLDYLVVKKYNDKEKQ